MHRFRMEEHAVYPGLVEGRSLSEKGSEEEQWGPRTTLCL